MQQTICSSPATASRHELELLVLWQNPDSRRYRAVGCLTFDGREYAFVYTKVAEEAFDEGFRGLPGLRDRSRSFRSETLFPFFKQRTMDPLRPDYEGYLDRLGLPSSATPLEQMMHSGGTRAADTIQLLQKPSVHDSSISLAFLVHGVRHIPSNNLGLAAGSTRISEDEHEKALADLRDGDDLVLLPEPNNPEHSEAVLVATGEGVPVGYVPRELSPGVLELSSEGEVSLKVLKLNTAQAPSHLRMIVQLEASNVYRNPFEGLWMGSEKA